MVIYLCNYFIISFQVFPFIGENRGDYFGKVYVDQAVFVLVIQQIIVFLWQPDPLMDSLEYVVGDHKPLDGTLEAAQTDAEVTFT